MVQHRSGAARNQISFSCLDDLIALDNPVRVIDAFADIVDFEALGFAHIKTNETGTPPYHPALLLKIYLYGYLNRVRSSRKLEKECTRNIEMWWLCEKQTPSYHTISTFRTFKNDDNNINHRKALKEVFRTFNRFLNEEGLFAKETVATDGSKFRAQNAKKKNFTMDKLDKKIEISELSIAQYLDELDAFDKAEHLNPQQILLQKDAVIQLQKLQKWKHNFEGLKTELTRRQDEDPDVTQISLTDPDARSIVLNNSGHAEVCYNIVTAVDDKHKLIVDFMTENVKDTTLLAESLIRVKVEFDNDFQENLWTNSENELDTEGVTDFDLTQKLNPNTTLNGLADKGFHAAVQLQECAEAGIITYVSIPKPAYSGKDKNFTIENFIYNQADDTYTCPNNQTLTTNGKFYDKKNHRGIVIQQFKRYNRSPKECAECPFAAKCLPKTAIKNRVSRQIERPKNQQAVVENKQRMDTMAGKMLYKKRQAIVEHPFGIIKRQWDGTYTLLRRKDKVNAEFAIFLTCFNLRRAMSIFGVTDLVNKLKSYKNTLFHSFKGFFTAILSHAQKTWAECGFFVNAAVGRNFVCDY